MQGQESIFVDAAGGRYPVLVGRGVLRTLGQVAARSVAGRSACVVTDSNVSPLLLPAAVDSLRGAGFAVSSAVIPAGEGSKCLSRLEGLWSAFHDGGLTRRDLVVALGGGVVGDLAGFAAATYMRGVAVVQVPTSLLAMVDSSIGGKTAIDVPFGKNLVGAFHQPSAVVSDPLALSTLPRREMAQGFAEALKTACILDGEAFSFLAGLAGGRPSCEDLERTIRFCAAAKAGVVSRDEKEGGLRAILNFGHTVGHAIEKTMGYGVVPHGEAVAVGMVAAAALGRALGLTPRSAAVRIAAALRGFSLPVCVADLPGAGAGCDAGAIASAMLSDKKKLGADIHFVLLEDVGRAKVVPLDPGRIRDALPGVLEETRRIAADSAP